MHRYGEGGKLSLRPISQAIWTVIDGQMRIPG